MLAGVGEGVLICEIFFLFILIYLSIAYSEGFCRKWEIRFKVCLF